jgi:hypothetical protein
LGAGLMAFVAGISRDALASYLPVFFAAGVFCMIAALSFRLLKGRSGPVLLTRLSQLDHGFGNFVPARCR